MRTVEKECFMKNTRTFLRAIGIGAMIAAIGLGMSACDTGTDAGSGAGGAAIPAQWHGTFGPHPYSLTLHVDGMITWAGWAWSYWPSGSRSGVTIVSGGAGEVPGMGLTLQWVYVSINGVRQGIIIWVMSFIRENASQSTSRTPEY